MDSSPATFRKYYIKTPKGKFGPYSLIQLYQMDMRGDFLEYIFGAKYWHDGTNLYTDKKLSKWHNYLLLSEVFHNCSSLKGMTSSDFEELDPVTAKTYEDDLKRDLDLKESDLDLKESRLDHKKNLDTGDAQSAVLMMLF